MRYDRRPDPTEEEIEAACAEIRKEWSEKTHQTRLAAPAEKPYEIPIVRNSIRTSYREE